MFLRVRNLIYVSFRISVTQLRNVHLQHADFYLGLYFSEQFKILTQIPHKIHVMDLDTFLSLDVAWL
jgi:hypothetical protein